jgi:hypothetical protein
VPMSKADLSSKPSQSFSMASSSRRQWSLFRVLSDLLNLGVELRPRRAGRSLRPEVVAGDEEPGNRTAHQRGDHEVQAWRRRFDFSDQASGIPSGRRSKPREPSPRKSGYHQPDPEQSQRKTPIFKDASDASRNRDDFFSPLAVSAQSMKTCLSSESFPKAVAG